MSPVKALRGKRGHTAMLIVWGLLVAGGMLTAGYFLGSAPGQIQSQRAEAVRVNCEEQNARHDATIAKLDQLIANLPANRKARALQGRAGTVLLIEALAPKRNCAALVRRSVSDPPDRQ